MKNRTRLSLPTGSLSMQHALPIFKKSSMRLRVPYVIRLMLKFERKNCIVWTLTSQALHDYCLSLYAPSSLLSSQPLLPPPPTSSPAVPSYVSLPFPLLLIPPALHKSSMEMNPLSATNTLNQPFIHLLMWN